MSKYALVRGWLECSFDESKEIRREVTRFATKAKESVLLVDFANNYIDGWLYPNKPINWVSFVFFGANVNARAIPFVKEMIQAASSIGSDDVSGIFYIDSEDDETPMQWVVSNGTIKELPRRE